MSTIKSVYELSKYIMLQLSNIDYEVRNQDLPFHRARARAEQEITDNITQDRQAFEKAIVEALDSLRSDWREDKIDYQKAIALVRSIYQDNK